MSDTREVIFYGSKTSGKSGVISLLCNEDFSKTNTSSPFSINININNVQCRLYNTDNYTLLSDDSKVAVIVFSNECYLSYTDAVKILIKIKNLNPLIKIIFCCSHSDYKRHTRIPDNETIQSKIDIDVFEVASSNINYGLEKLIDAIVY